jgi:hypothetical protein
MKYNKNISIRKSPFREGDLLRNKKTKVNYILRSAYSDIYSHALNLSEGRNEVLEGDELNDLELISKASNLEKDTIVLFKLLTDELRIGYYLEKLPDGHKLIVNGTGEELIIVNDDDIITMDQFESEYLDYP